MGFITNPKKHGETQHSQRRSHHRNRCPESEEDCGVVRIQLVDPIGGKGLVVCQMFDPFFVGIKIFKANLCFFFVEGFPEKKKTQHCLGWCHVMTPEKVWSLLSEFFFRGLCQVGWCTTNLKFENLTFDLVAIFSNWAYPFFFCLVTPFFHLEVWSGDPTNFKLLTPKKGKKHGKSWADPNHYCSWENDAPVIYLVHHINWWSGYQQYLPVF